MLKMELVHIAQDNHELYKRNEKANAYLKRKHKSEIAEEIGMFVGGLSVFASIFAMYIMLSCF